MRVIETAGAGAPDVLRVAERLKPVPASGEVLIDVRAAGVSRADAMQRQGHYPPPPGASDILGLEVSGIIEAAGAGVSEWRRGDRVCALLTGGGYAEYVAVPSGQVLPIPENWNFVEAASLPENMFTAYDNAITRARMGEGQSILIHGGTSGIGTTAIMLCAALRASFIAATAGSPRKCEACRGLGADLAIDYNDEDFVAAVLRATNGRGVDVVFDVVGADYIARDLDALGLDGRIVSIATARGSAAEIDLGKMMRKRATLTTSSLRPRTVEQKAAIAAELRARVWPLLPARDPIRPVIDSTFRLEQASEAHLRLESSQHIGKIVLVVKNG